MEKSTTTGQKHTFTANIMKAIAVALNMKSYDVAAAAAINRQQFYDYTSGKTVPKFEVWAKLKKTFPQISGDYILTGEGNVLI